MRAKVLHGLALLFTVGAVACGTSVDAPSGLDQPIVVKDASANRLAQFFSGSFPKPVMNVAPVSNVILHSLAVRGGISDKAISGVAGTSSPSVAMALKGYGSGYWVLPTSVPDPGQQLDLVWSATMNFSHTLPAGDYTLLLSASDTQGNFSEALEQPLKLTSFIPTGHVVASLSWDSAADLDLRLTSPDGKQQTAKHPNTGEFYDAGPDAGQLMPGSGLLDHDSNSGCVQDGYRNENVVWSDDPTPGTYVVNIDMFNACGAPAANFTFSLSVDGQEVLHKVGRLLDIDADGGGAGLFVTEFNCEGTGTCS